MTDDETTVIMPRTLSYDNTIIRKPRNVACTRTCKIVVVVSEKSCKETGNHSFHLLVRKNIDELACFLLCLPKKQKIRELFYPLDPLISPFRTHGGPVDTPIWTDNSLL